VGEKKRQLLRPEIVSDRLDIPVTTLYQWRHRGVGPPAIRIGRHLRYDEAELEAWIETQAEASQ
jgi:excisionase family DNA binding protein